jgi:hypothetical protein
MRSPVHPTSSEALKPYCLTACLLGMTLAGSGLPAQDSPARVLPPGALSVQVGGTFTAFTHVYGAPGAGGGERTAYSAPFPARLTPDVFRPLQILESRLEQVLGRLFEEEEQEEGQTPAPVGPLMVETSAVHFTADRREVPLTLELGVFPRFSVHVRLPLTQDRLEVSGLDVAGGTVGMNPDPVSNRQLLLGVDTALANLAGGRLLPVAGTEAGFQLQEAVRTLTAGEELRLPVEAAGGLGIGGVQPLPGLDAGAYRPDEAIWGLGDATVSARFALVNTFGMAPAPVLGAGLRATAEAGIRLPTGNAATSSYLGVIPPEEGLGGFFVVAAVDAFATPRWGASGQLRWESLGSVEVGRRTWTAPDEDFLPVPVDGTVLWDPGSRVSLAVLPTFQLVPEIGITGRYSFARQSGETVGGWPGAPSGVRSAHLWGVGFTYSTLGAGGPRAGTMPFEASFRIASTVAGSGGQPATRSVQMGLRFYRRIWGGGASR